MSLPAEREGERAGAAPRRLPPAWTITALLAVIYLILAPYSPDLAAASYRSDLFGRVGLSLWDNSWYGGHHLLAYSLVAPALGSLIGPRLVAALSMTIAAGLFAIVIEGRFPARATRLAAAWLALGAGIGLLSSRVPFDLGFAIGLASLALAQRRRLWPALAFAVLCSLASPVAGAFLALAYLAWALAGPVRTWPTVLTLAALAPIGLLSLAFPEGGSQPFVPSAFYPALLGTIIVGALIGREQRALRIGALLYALALTGSYLLPTAVGGNADRLGSLVAGPVVACVLVGAGSGGSLRPSRRGGLALLVLAPFLLYWQANAPVADFAAATSDPAVHASYYVPLLGELKRLDIGYSARPARIEVVPTVDHWEARWLAPHVTIARGWERQLDRYRNMLFYEEGGATKALAPAVYERWLARNAISYIALPDAPLDYSAKAEARLLRAAGGLSYLREVWHSRHWRLFALRDPTPLVQPPARLTSLGSESMTVIAPQPGNYILRVHFTSYWALASGAGCVEEAPGEWTEIHARQAGSFHVVIRFSLARLFSEGPRCR